MSSTSLASLPPEILQQIYGNFCLHCLEERQPTAPDAYFRNSLIPQQRNELSWYSVNCHALFSSCLVSSRIREIAQPILYHEFMPGYGDSWRSTSYTWEGRLSSFMRTVMEYRDLARLVTRIFIHPFLMEYMDHEEVEDTIQQATRTLGMASYQLLSPSDLVGLLIALLPRLEHCSLQVPENDFRLSWIGLRMSNPSGLPLKTIDISMRAARSQSFYYMFNLGRHTGNLLEMATGLETLNIHMCDGTFWFQGDIPLLPNLKTLRITFTRLGEQHIERLLSSCTSLHTFVYEATSPADDARQRSGNGRMHFQLSDVIQHLTHHRETLTSLHLDLRARGWTVHDEGQTLPSKLSLKEFSKLEHLFINSDEIYHGSHDESPIDSWILIELLPSSIVSLYIAGPGTASKGLSSPHRRRANYRLINGLLSLADPIARELFSSLKKVKCDRVFEQFFNEYAMADVLEAAGIDFAFEYRPRSLATLEESDLPPPIASPEPLPEPLPYPQ